MNQWDYDFESLKNYVARLRTVVKELEVLEDFEDANYTEIKNNIKQCTVLLEQRREQLQKRGRTL